MKNKFTLVFAISTSALFFGQNTPDKVIKGNSGMYAQLIKFEKSQPSFDGSPLLFDDESNSFA